MTTDDVQPLNYAAHAIEDLRRLLPQMRAEAPKSAEALEMLIRRLRDSIKFLLPNCCDLIAVEDLRQSHLDLLKLPFPCIALEASWIAEEQSPDVIGGQPQAAATKRIALCWEILPDEVKDLADLELDAEYEQGGVFVVPIFWGPAFGRWVVPVGGVFVPYGNAVVALDPDRLSAATRIEREALLAAGQASDRAKGFRAEPVVLFPELFERAVPRYGGRAQALAHVSLDTHDEVMMLIQACAVLNCANVTTEDLTPSASLNRKRKVNGKQPFFSYKVLQLSDERHRVGEPAGGHHVSPRMHLRRGHLRRLEKKTVWVRPAMVNAASTRGVVAKDYQIAPRE